MTLMRCDDTMLVAYTYNRNVLVRVEIKFEHDMDVNYASSGMAMVLMLSILSTVPVCRVAKLCFLSF